MTINEQVYGKKTEWPYGSFNDSTTSGFKVAWFGTDDYVATGVINNFLPKNINEIDLSISPWAIGKDAWFNQLRYTYPARSGTTLIDACDKYNDTPIVIKGYSVSTLYNNWFIDRNYKKNNTETNSMHGSYLVEWCTQFNYNSMVGVCGLIVAKSVSPSGTSDVKTVTVDKYFNGSSDINKTSYPIILAGIINIYLESEYDGEPIRYSNRLNASIMPYRIMKDMSYLNRNGIESYVDTDMLFLNSFCYTTDIINNISDFIGTLIVFGDDPFRGGVLTDSDIEDTSESTFIKCTDKLRNIGISSALAPANTKTLIYNITSTTKRLMPYWDNLTKEDVLKQFAYLGIWFTDDFDYVQEKNGIECTSQHMYCPVFNSYGITTGEYKAGDEAAKLPNAKWEDPYEDNNDYDPNKKDEGDEDIKSGVLSFTFKGLTSYVLTNDEFDKVNKVVNTITNYSDTKAQWYDIDPANFITAVHFFPFTLTPSKLTDFVLGTTDFELNGEKLQFHTGLGVSDLNFGSVYIKPYYNDFRDYSPYTTYTLYIPFIGTYDIDPLAFVGHYMTLDFTVDHTTHSYIGLIYRDNFVYDYLQGSIGMSIPMTAVNQGQYSQAMAMLQRDKGRLNNSSLWDTALSVSHIIGNAANGDIAGTSNSFISAMGHVTDYPYQMYGINYALEHTKPSFVSVSNSNGAYNLQSDRYCRIIIQRHYTLPTNLEFFGNTIGFACNISDVLSNIHGYTVATNISFNSADFTSVEENLIRSAFSEGVILP